VAKLYFDLIQKGLKVLDDVPNAWRVQVESLLINSDVDASDSEDKL